MKFAAVLAASLLVVAPALAETITIFPARDATLIEDPGGALANGSGPAFFVGRTNQGENSIRRALLLFDVAAAIPDRAVIEGVTLGFYVAPSNAGEIEIRLHRVLEDWGEGPSSSAGGGGAPAEPGDVTWIHTFYDAELWVREGGHLVARASAEIVVGVDGSYTFAGDERMLADLRLWQSAPRRNFGWLLIGDETTRQNVKSIASREHPEEQLRPFLEITYRLAGDPAGD